MGKQTRFDNVSNVFSDCVVSEPSTLACRARSQMNYFTSQDTCRYFESDYGGGQEGTRESYNYSRLKDDVIYWGEVSRGNCHLQLGNSRERERERERDTALVSSRFSFELSHQPTIGAV